MQDSLRLRRLNSPYIKEVPVKKPVCNARPLTRVIYGPIKHSSDTPLAEPFVLQFVNGPNAQHINHNRHDQPNEPRHTAPAPLSIMLLLSSLSHGVTPLFHSFSVSSKPPPGTRGKNGAQQGRADSETSVARKRPRLSRTAPP